MRPRRRKRCDWCAITLAGPRRWFTDKCRACYPRFAKIYDQGIPPFYYGQRRGQVDRRRFHRGRH